MILKIMSLFLVGMMVLAMFGKLRMPRLPFARAKTCKKCGAPLIGKTPCFCETNGTD